MAVAGPIPAANYLQLPKDRADSLGLTGPFLYLQVAYWLTAYVHGLQPFIRLCIDSIGPYAFYFSLMGAWVHTMWSQGSHVMSKHDANALLAVCRFW